MTQTFLYIDPGTGSMLFSLAIGVATTLVFAVRALAVKLRFIFSGGKVEKISQNKIPYVVFSDHKRYWNVFKPICDEFEKRKIPLVYYTQSEDDPALSEKYEFVKAEFIGTGNKGFVKMNMLNAGTVISTTPGLDVLQWKRSKTVDRYVHVPHAVSEVSTYRMFALDYYDAVLVNGNHQIEDLRKIESLRPKIQKKDCVVVGCTYMDANLEHIKTLPVHNQNVETPTVLVAPSWGKSAILSKFGEKFLDSLVQTGFNIVVRPHPQSKTAEKELLETLEARYKDSKNLLWNYDNDNLAVMNESDILITDFSGIIFDYTLLMNRPLIYADTEFDSAVYDAAWIEDTLWTFKVLPEIGIKLDESQFQNIKEIILNAMKSTELLVARDKVKSECWQNIGHSAEKIVDYVISCQNDEKGDCFAGAKKHKEII